MPRTRLVDPRFDLRGGVNTSHSDEILSKIEVRRCENGRPGPVIGAVRKVGGSQRIHTNQLNGNILGIRTWDGAGGQIIGSASGDLFYKTFGASLFTVVASQFSAANRLRFAQHRVGAAVKLYIADGATMKVWDGAALAAVAGAPANPWDIAVYKGRLFAIDRTKKLYASKVSDPTTWPPTALTFSGDVETFDAEGLQGILVIGSSMLLCKADNIARFTGIDQSDIQIDTQTEGVSPEDGLIAPYTLIAADKSTAFGVGARGPWLANEDGLDINLGLAVADQFDFADRSLWANAVAHNDVGRHCIRLWIPDAGDGGLRTAWEYNYQTKTWSGPRKTTFAVTAATRYKTASNYESTLVGGSDGWVRELEVRGVNALEDVNQDGTGGTAIPLDVQFPPIIGDDPTRLKNMRQKSTVQADLGVAGQLYAYWQSELDVGETLQAEDGEALLLENGQPLEAGGGSVAIATLGPGVRHYPFKLFAKGARITYGFYEGTSEIVQINGVWPVATLSRRVR